MGGSQDDPVDKSIKGPPPPMWMKRLLSTKEEDNRRAYQLQVKGATEGAIRWTIYSTLACIAGHVLVPRFKRQTLAFKGFLISSAAMSGMVIWADHYLLRLEKWQRKADDLMRQQARQDLGRQGIIVTEKELNRWKLARLEEYKHETNTSN